MASRHRRGRHARPSRAVKIARAAGSAAVPGVAAGVLLAGSAHPGGSTRDSVLAQASPAVAAWHLPYRAVSDDTYTVQPGDYLSAIAVRLCGNPADWTGFAVANRIANPDRIFSGERLSISCTTASVPAAAAHPASAVVSAPVVTDSRLSGTLDCIQLEDLWDTAGGSRAEAFTAAEIAMAESGGNQFATGTVGERGYWQINPDHGSLSTYDPMGNAEAAVEISGNGTDWIPWTTFTSGEFEGRC